MLQAPEIVDRSQSRARQSRVDAARSIALTPEGNASRPAPSLYAQLSKQGLIAGTLHNAATGATQTLEGMVDKQSQRAAGGVAGKQRLVRPEGPPVKATPAKQP